MIMCMKLKLREKSWKSATRSRYTIIKPFNQ